MRKSNLGSTDCVVNAQTTRPCTG